MNSYELQRILEGKVAELTFFFFNTHALFASIPHSVLIKTKLN